MKLSILMPVYNERTVVERCISGVLTAPLPENMDRELVIVDDCSTDGTFAILQRLATAFPQIRLYQHSRNRGKGAAVRTAIEKATGDFSLIQDADLEYDPAEYPRLMRPLLIVLLPELFQHLHQRLGLGNNQRLAHNLRQTERRRGPPAPYSDPALVPNPQHTASSLLTKLVRLTPKPCLAPALASVARCGS